MLWLPSSQLGNHIMESDQNIIQQTSWSLILDLCFLLFSLSLFNIDKLLEKVLAIIYIIYNKEKDWPNTKATCLVFSAMFGYNMLMEPFHQARHLVSLCIQTVCLFLFVQNHTVVHEQTLTKKKTTHTIAFSGLTRIENLSHRTEYRN